jgi:hypothetical protein
MFVWNSGAKNDMASKRHKSRKDGPDLWQYQYFCYVLLAPSAPFCGYAIRLLF